jgi:CysZ protein
MIVIVFIAIILQLFFFLIYFIFSSILGLSFFDEIAYFIISSFFYGFAFFDYSLERDKIGVFGSLGFAFSNMLLVSLTGAFFLLLYKTGSFFVGSFSFSFLSIIPNLGIIAAPVLTTILATYVYILNKQETNDRTQK